MKIQVIPRDKATQGGRTIQSRKQFSSPLKGGNSDIITADTVVGEGAQGIAKKLTCVRASNCEDARHIWN